MSDLKPPGPELRRANRLLLAERFGWPAGAAQACDEIEDDNPAWLVWYVGDGARSNAGWYASHADHAHMERDVYGATPRELREAIGAHWCSRYPRRDF